MTLPTPNNSWLSTEDWYHYSQKFLESSYLQPFQLSSNGSKVEMRTKKNVQNGFIEREIHGAMHASRVALSTFMLNRLCLKQYPDLVQNKIQALTKLTKLNEQELFYLISYVGLGHDAARQGEGGDLWEKESATEIENFLNQRGLDPKLAKIFSTLAFLKDKPEELKKFLAENKLSQEAIEGLEYAHLLISLSDCFDIIRCASCFDFSFIEKKLAEVFPYSQDKDAEVFFDYAKHLYHLILKQKDLYFANKLKGPNGKIYQVEQSVEDYSVQEKVKFEHASSVLGVMVHAFNQNEYFKPLLNMETPKNCSTFDKELVFNPYIHGTSSSTLALMTQTNFQLMPVADMLEEYQLAPLCGEITQGGFGTASDTGNPCFAKLSGEENSNEYHLKRIVSNYTVTQDAVTQEECIKKLKLYASDAKNDLYSSINIINIYLARAKQLGINLQEIPELASLEQDFESCMEVFYLYLLFSSHLVAKEIDHSDEETDIGAYFKRLNALEDEIKEHFSLKIFFEKLKQSKISIKEIYKDPTPENCNKIISLLTLPEASKDSSLLEYSQKPLNRGKERRFAKEFGYVVKNTSSWKFEDILYKLCKGEYVREDFNQAAPLLLSYMQNLEKRFLVTQKLLKQLSEKPLAFTVEDSDLIKDPLPIIFCYNQSSNIRILSLATQEYRSNKSLKLGVDIQIVATDTEANIKRLQAYSDRHHLNLKVVSFADLEHTRLSLKSEHPLTTKQFLALKTEAPAIRPVLNKNKSVSNRDINALRDFCAQQKNRFSDTKTLESLLSFEKKAEKIILSEHSPVIKREKLISCAHQEFEHRDYIPRILADILLLISSLALIGLVVGFARVANGHSFFFSEDKTKREAEFYEVAHAMKLSS